MAGTGAPLPELTLRIHVRILAEPLHFTIAAMVDAADRVFAAARIRVEVASEMWLDLPGLPMSVRTGDCIRGVLTPHLELLFAQREGMRAGEVVVYFVRELLPRTAGCAAHPPDAPGALVAGSASRWTLAHELGHVLGLDHVNDTRRLMFGFGTALINRVPPLLIPSEIAALRASALLEEEKIDGNA